MNHINMTEFLSDPTGNVRWIHFEINRIEWNYSKEVDIDTVWAQAYLTNCTNQVLMVR